ncbi:MAG: response regulator [Gammaproteobacteria bacterium]|nr:response regulator [Gammaproteobacteria bacterium]
MTIHSLYTIRQSKDFYSAVIRLSLGLFIALYVWLGKSGGEFSLTEHEYNTFASFFFIVTLLLGADIFRNPDSNIRRYITLCFDMCCTTYIITLTGWGDSEFIMIYIWLYIAYGTRYGSRYLFTAVALVLIQYNYILIIDGKWSNNTLGSFAQMFLLITMPLYLHSMLRQLRDAKQAAELATRAKSNFLATMSHEIRTPMSGIIGMAHLLQRTNPDKQQKEYIKPLLDASKSLHALIDDILDFSKIEANKLYLQNSAFDLHHTVNEVVTVLSPNAECHALDLIVYIDPELPTSVIGDYQRIKQILFNLLGNAIKFTKKGEIILKVTPEKTPELNHFASSKPIITLRFDIIDTGIGISEEQQNHIFDSFAQAEDLQIHKFGGTGLGTTISKQLVEKMGGTIGLKSTLGSGSHFWFILSLPIEKNSEFKDTYSALFCDKKSKKIKIALLIHNDSLYETIKNYCQFFGFTLQRFDSEADVLNGLCNSQQAFDLLILSAERDKNLPTQLNQNINLLKLSPESQPKKIFLSYLNKDMAEQKYAYSLFDGCINKPINFEQLANEFLTQLVPNFMPEHKITCSDLSDISLTILIAEDEDINAMVLSSFLHNFGHTTKRVKDGVLAVEELLNNHYDIAFMDMHMPVMNGIDATLNWREREPKGQHIPIIALTANATQDDKTACLNAGMDDFITKPITPEHLSNTIIKFYSNSHKSKAT